MLHNFAAARISGGWASVTLTEQAKTERGGRRLPSARSRPRSSCVRRLGAMERRTDATPQSPGPPGLCQVYSSVL